MPDPEEQVQIPVDVNTGEVLGEHPLSTHPRALQMVNVLAQFPRIMDRLQIEFAMLVKEVVANDQGKPGEITLRLQVAKPNPKSRLMGRELIVTADIKVKEPSDAPHANLFFHDEEGGLHMSDPYQRPMFGRG